MNPGINHYAIKGVEGQFRFAYEFSHYQPIDQVFVSESSHYEPKDRLWQPFYFKYFAVASEEKKPLPFVLNINRDDLTQEITIIRFVSIEDCSSKFFEIYDHLILVALVELSTKETVIIPCF